MSMQVREGQKINWDRVDVREMDTYPQDTAGVIANSAVGSVCRVVAPCSAMPNLSNPRRDDLSAESMWATRND